MAARMNRLALLALFACAMTLPPLMTIAAAAPRGAPLAGPLLVIHPPWIDGADLVTRAGGRPIGLSDSGITTLAAAPDAATFAARIQAVGPGLVVTADRLPFLCTEARTASAAPLPSALRPLPRS